MIELYSSVATLPIGCELEAELDEEEDRHGRATAFTLARVPPPDDWAERGTCHEAPDTNIFFPHYSDTTEEAKSYCARCPVIKECREFALRYPMLKGIWGGLNERERKRRREWQRAS